MIIHKSSFPNDNSFNYFCKCLIRELRNTDIKVTFNTDGMVVISKDTKVISKVENMILEFKQKNSILNEREKMDHLYSLVLNNNLINLSQINDKRLAKFWIMVNKRAISSYKNQKNVSLEELETTHTIALIENIKRERKLKK